MRRKLAEFLTPLRSWSVFDKRRFLVKMMIEEESVDEGYYEDWFVPYLMNIVKNNHESYDDDDNKGKNISIGNPPMDMKRIVA